MSGWSGIRARIPARGLLLLSTGDPQEKCRPAPPAAHQRIRVRAQRVRFAGRGLRAGPRNREGTLPLFSRPSTTFGDGPVFGRHALTGTATTQRGRLNVVHSWRSGSLIWLLAPGCSLLSCRSRSISESSSIPSRAAMLVSHNQIRNVTIAPSVP